MILAGSDSEPGCGSLVLAAAAVMQMSTPNQESCEQMVQSGIIMRVDGPTGGNEEGGASSCRLAAMCTTWL